LFNSLHLPSATLVSLLSDVVHLFPPLYIVSVFLLSPVGLLSIVPCPFPIVLSVFLVLPVDPACRQPGFSASPFWTLFFCKLFCLIKECFFVCYSYCVQPVSLRLSLTPSQEPDIPFMYAEHSHCFMLYLKDAHNVFGIYFLKIIKCTLYLFLYFLLMLSPLRFSADQ